MAHTYADSPANTYRRAYGDERLQSVRHDDSPVSYVLENGTCIGEVWKGYPTFRAVRYGDEAERRFDSERDWDHTKTVLPWVAGRID